MTRTVILRRKATKDLQVVLILDFRYAHLSQDGSRAAD
jgi:hypothetical protein